MRPRTLYLTAASTFIVVLVATLPARFVAARLPPEIGLEGVRGSVFHGSAEQLLLRGAPLGTLSWTLRPGALLRLALGYHLDLDGPQTQVHGDVAAGLGGLLVVDATRLSLPLALLSGAPPGDPGRLAGEIRHARLRHGWPAELEATLRLEDVRPPMLPAPVGSYEVRFTGSGGTPSGDLRGVLHDLPGAAFGLDGTLTLKPDRTYAVEGRLATGAHTPPSALPALEALGPPDAAGRRAFSLGGTY